MLTRADVLRRIELVPPLPQVVTDLLASIASDASLAEVERVIQRDPILCVKVVRLANSPLIGAGRATGSLRQALSCLGMRTIRTLALSCSAMPKAGLRVLAAYGERPDGFALHALSVGVLARRLATAQLFLSPADADAAFLMGIVHDLGKLIIGPMFIEVGADLRGKNEGQVASYEKELLGIDHVEVGGLLATQWKLPIHLPATHFEVSSGPPRALALADLMCEATAPSRELLGGLGVEVTEFDSLAKLREEAISEAGALVSVIG
jgi:HD-like signal output (HDOD) protein